MTRFWRIFERLTRILFFGSTALHRAVFGRRR